MRKRGKNIRNIGIVFGVGLLVGILMGISIRYPVTVETVATGKELCSHTNGMFKTIKIGLTGKVYEVVCSDDRTLYVK